MKLQLLLMLSLAVTTMAAHPALISKSRLDQLAAGGTDWTTIKQYCDNNLKTLIAPDYAGWGWRTAVENYSTAYQVVRQSDTALAGKYAKKTLALMKVLARHHNYGGPVNAQLLAKGDGTTKVFTLPMNPMMGTNLVVLTAPVRETLMTYSTSAQVLSDFEPIVKISNTPNGAANYSSTDYKLLYRDGLTVFVLKWLTNNHPSVGAAYYVTQTTGSGTVVTTSQYTVSGTTLSFTTAPSATQAVFVRYLSDNYEQTGNFMGGASSVMPDGPGYQMRTFNPGLAFGFDLMYDYSGFTASLKEEFADVLNQQIDWFKTYGYERDGDLGNYFIRGLLTGTLFTAYGTEGANSRTAELKTLADSYIQRPYTKLDVKLPGGFGPQGQYANGVATDVLQVFTIYKDLTGNDLLAQLEWTSNIIPATIHGTKPDRNTFYDGGDWSDLPAVPLTGLVTSFLSYLPDHAMAPYARQLLKDIGESVPSGSVTDYKTLFPCAYFSKVSGPIYARSDWNTGAVWLSLAAGEVFMDHQGLDQGHITIQRGSDYLLCDGGGYGDLSTNFHNTLLFDDRGAGDISTYPPGQGYWGFDRTGIRAFEQGSSFVYGLSDFTQAYAKAHDGKQNSVKMAVRSMLYIRPGCIVIHDRAQTFRADVKKTFNCNLTSSPVVTGNVSKITLGNSALFIKALVPSAILPVVTPIAGQPIAKFNYQETVIGQVNSSFLHVFEAVASTQTSMSLSSLVNAVHLEGVELALGDTNWTGLFSKTDTVYSGSEQYGFTLTGKHHDIISDLPRNMVYKVLVTSGGKSIIMDTSLPSSENGLLHLVYHSGDTGTVNLTPTGIAGVNDVVQSSNVANLMNVKVSSGIITVRLSLSQTQNVSIKLFDILGRAVAVKPMQKMVTGNHQIQMNPKKTFSSGIYIVQASFEKNRMTKVCVIVR